MEPVPVRANRIVSAQERGLTVYCATPHSTARVVVPATGDTSEMLVLCDYPTVPRSRHWAISLIPSAPLAVAFARDLAIQLVRAALPANAQALSMWREAQCVALYALPADAQIDWSRARLVTALQPLVDAGHWVGVSLPVERLDAVDQALGEAIDTARACRMLERRAIGYRSELALYDTIQAVRQSPARERLLNEILAPLEIYDRHHGTELTETLAVFLRENGNAVQAARRLAVHRNTLNYRLQRISDISGLDLDRAEERLMLHLALCLRADT